MLTSVLNKQTPRTAGESLVYNALCNATSFTNPPAISANTAVVSNTSLYVAGTTSNLSNYLYNVPFTANGTFPTSNASYSNGLIQGVCLNPSSLSIRYASSYISNAQRYVAMVDACLNFSTSTYADDITSLTAGTPGTAIPLAVSSAGPSNATFVGAGSTLYLGTAGLTTPTTAVIFGDGVYSNTTTNYSNTGFRAAYNIGTGIYTFTITSGTIATLSNAIGFGSGKTVVVSGFDSGKDTDYNGSYLVDSVVSSTVITLSNHVEGAPRDPATNLSNGVISYSNTSQTLVSNQSLIYTVSNSGLFRPLQAITITGAGADFNYTSVPVTGIYSSTQIKIANVSNRTSTATFTSPGTISFNSYVPVNSPDGYSILAAGPAAYFPGLFADARMPIASASSNGSSNANYVLSNIIPAFINSATSNVLASDNVGISAREQTPPTLNITGFTGSDASWNATFVAAGATANTPGLIGAGFSSGGGAVYTNSTKTINVGTNGAISGSPSTTFGAYAFFPITSLAAFTGTDVDAIQEGTYSNAYTITNIQASTPISGQATITYNTAVPKGAIGNGGAIVKIVSGAPLTAGSYNIVSVPTSNTVVVTTALTGSYSASVAYFTYPIIQLHTNAAVGGLAGAADWLNAGGNTLGTANGSINGCNQSNYGSFVTLNGFVPTSFNGTFFAYGSPLRKQRFAICTNGYNGSNAQVVGTMQLGASGAAFDVYVMSNSTTYGPTLSYFVQLTNPGFGYASNMQLVLFGSNLGGTSPTNDLKITITEVINTTPATDYTTLASNFYGISKFTFTGTPAATAVSISNGLTAYIYSNISPSTVPYIQSNANYTVAGIIPTGYNISNAAVLYTTSAATKFFSPYNLSNGLSNATVNCYGSDASGGGTSNFLNTGLFVISNLGGYNGNLFQAVGKAIVSVPVGAYSAFANVTYTAAGGGVNNNSYTLYALQSNVSNSYQKIVVAVNGNVTTPTGDVSASYTNPWFVSNSPIGTLIQPTVTMSGPDTIVIDSSSGFVYMLDTTSNIYRATTNVTVSNTTYNGIVYPGTTIGGATMTSAFGIPSTLFVSTAIGGANVLYSIYSYPITATNIAGMYVFSVTPGY